jgi:hypothetical protein
MSLLVLTHLGILTCKWITRGEKARKQKREIEKEEEEENLNTFEEINLSNKPPNIWKSYISYDNYISFKHIYKKGVS